MVAVLASDLGSRFNMMMFQGINKVLEVQGYHILVHNVRHEDQSDPGTLASLHACRPAGYIILLEIPGDLSVVGFDGVDFAELLGPPLTTVNVFPQMLGERAAELLLKVIRNETDDGVAAEWIQPEMVERASVRAL